jgi:hypothetical protein
MTLGTPALLLYVFVVFTQLMTGFYFASGIEPPPLFQLLYLISFLWVIGWWLRTDTKKRQIAWVYDMGLFLYLAWPFVLFYYLIQSRGLKGLLLIGIFIVVYVGSLVAGAALYLLLAPPQWPRL